MRKQIDNCLDTLSSREGEMIRLRVFEEKEYEEICEIMNLSMDATRKAYSRALKKFETVYLDRYGNYE